MVEGEELLLVTVGGECFQARLKHKWNNPARSSLETLWVLEDKVWGRPNLRVAALLPDETVWQIAEWSTVDHDLLVLNGVRRAFDSGEIHFDDNVLDEGPPKEVIVHPSALEPEENFVGDTRAESLILYRAYWEGYKYPAPSGHFLDFAVDRDLEYIGVDRNAIQRNVWLLGECGSLKVHPTQTTVASPTHELIKSYRSGAPIAEGRIQIFPADSQKESRSEIRKIIGSAKIALTIADNYVDESILEILRGVSRGVRTKILTEHVPLDFGAAIDRFLMVRQAVVEVRTHVRKIHDRFILIDESRAYGLGASIKDAGKKIWHLHMLDDRLQLTKLKNLLGAEWDSATRFWPPS